MSEAVLLDLIHGFCPTCCASLLEERAAEPHVFLLCGHYQQNNSCTDTSVLSGSSVQVLDFSSTAECLYRFKQTVDGLNLSLVTVLTSPQGRQVLRLYQDLLFTAAYTFDYKVKSVDSTCLSCRSLAHKDPPGERVHEEVCALLQQLPALQGDVTTLASSLIPGGFQGHGCIRRAG